MDTQDEFLCQECGKKIQFERPLFCPYCGTKIDPTVGLVTDKDGELELYKWSRIAPVATQILVGWLVLLLPMCVIWGRSGFFILSGIFVLTEGIILLAGWLHSRTSAES